MREVLTVVRGLLRHRELTGAWVALGVGGSLLTGVPLLRAPGYELALALSVLHGLFGGPFGILAVRHSRAPGLGHHPAQAVLAAIVLCWLALVPPFLTATIITLSSTPCSPWATAEFFPILTLPSSLVSVCLGGLVGLRLKGGWAQGLGWLGVLLASALHTAWPLVFGPQAYVYNHLGGYLPGPLYDEELHVPRALYLFRLGTLLLSAHALLHLVRPSRATWAALVGTALAFVGLEVSGPALGFRMDDETLFGKLGGRRESKEIILRYQVGTDERAVDDMLADARFRAWQIGRFFEASPPGPVTVFWYPSPDEKQRLVGAAHTQFSKPWRREIHIHSMGFPHPVLKHELVHALAAPWGKEPFGITASLWGLWPNIGVIEGMAVAADNPIDELTLAGWAAAMKRRGLFPDVRVLLGPSGFYAAPAARAYTAAGAFLRFLTETYGGERTRRLYRDGNFPATFDRSLDELATQFERSLDAEPVDEAADHQAQARFRRGSIFERPCAREVALLAASAASQPPAMAVEAWRRCRALQPAEPGHVLSEARVLLRLGRTDDAARLLDGQLARLVSEPAAWADAALARVEVAIARDETALARGLLERLLAEAQSPAVERAALVRLAGLAGSPTEGAALREAFDGSSHTRLTALREASASGNWAVLYMLGRALYREGAWRQALEWLERSELASGCPATIAREAHRLALETAFRAGDCASVRRLAAQSRFGPTFDARAADWIDRCDFAHHDAQPSPPEDARP